MGTAAGYSRLASPAPPTLGPERVGGACRYPPGPGQPPAPGFPASFRTKEVGKGGHRACVLGGVTRVGKPSASAILAASVGLFSYHVNRRRRPVRGGGKAVVALSEKGKKTTRGRGVEVGRRGDPRPGGGGGSGQSRLKQPGNDGGGGRTSRLTEPGGGGSSGRSRNDAGREPPAQGERALQADLGKCEALGKQCGGFSRYTGLSPLTSARRAPGHPRPGPRLRTPSQAECTPSFPSFGSHLGSRARDQSSSFRPHVSEAVVPE